MVLGNATLTLNEASVTIFTPPVTALVPLTRLRFLLMEEALPKVTPNIFITAILPMVLPNDILMQRFISVAMFRSHS